jgi:hypothetical protein
MKITKNQLRRIIKEEKQKLLAESRIRNAVRRQLSEMYGGEIPDSGPSPLGRDKKVEYVHGSYMVPGASFVTDSEDHPLDQLQDLLDMGVRIVEDGESDMGVMPIMKWVDIVVDVSSDNDDDDVYGPPRRWKGGR